MFAQRRISVCMLRKYVLKPIEFILIAFAFLLLSPVMLLATISKIIEMPFNRRRMKQLKQAIETNWLPKQKFAMVIYDPEGPFNECAQKIIKKWEKHILSKELYDLKSLIGEYGMTKNTLLELDGYTADDAPYLAVKAVSPKYHEVFDLWWVVDNFADNDGSYFTFGKRFTRKEAEAELNKKLEEFFASWNVG